jgi:hypothetical protein
MKLQQSGSLRKRTLLSLLIAVSTLTPIMPAEANAPRAPEAPTTWLACASEYQGCTFSG